MEISIKDKDIEQALLLDVDSTEPALVEYFQEWEKHAVEDVILNKINHNGQHEVWRVFTSLRNRLTAIEPEIRESGLKELAIILIYQKRQLLKAFQSNDLKALLVFLNISIYLNVPLTFFIDKAVISESEINVVVAAVSKIVGGYVLKLDLQQNARYFEKKLIEKYKQGITDENIKDVYNLIENIERGRGILAPYHFINLLRFLYELAKNDFFNFIAQVKEPIMSVIVITWMTTEQLITVAQQELINNKWLRLEILRQIFDVYEKKEMGENETIASSRLLHRLYKQDSKFFNQAYTYFEQSNAFNKALGRMLTLFSKDQVVSFVEENFSFTGPTRYWDQKNILLNEFMNSDRSNLTEALLSIVYRKWEMFMDNQLEQHGLYVNDPELTDYANYAIYYLQNYSDIRDRVQLWDATMTNIKRLDSYWYIDSYSRKARLLLLISKLYIYTLSLFQNKINRLENYQKQQLESLFNSPIFCKRYLDSYHTFSKFKISDLVNDIANKFDLKLTKSFAGRLGGATT